MANPIKSCPLCRANNGMPYFQDHRDFFQCQQCQLVFVPERQFLSREEEKRHYDLHENSPGDPQYRRFLSRLFEPVSQRLTKPSPGLDFGSGPGPTLSVMFEEAGHRMEIYDPFYAPNASVLDRQYDFITASEVVEHLHHPERDLDAVWACVSPGGVLGVMTKRVRDREAFATWHYKDDPTHVCFFSVATFEWQAERWAAKLTIIGPDVVLFRKSTGE